MYSLAAFATLESGEACPHTLFSSLRHKERASRQARGVHDDPPRSGLRGGNTTCSRNLLLG